MNCDLSQTSSRCRSRPLPSPLPAAGCAGALCSEGGALWTSPALKPNKTSTALNMPAVASNSTQELSLLPCDAELCHSNGRCFVLNERIDCECWLGYTGPFCEDRVNKSISIPLTLGVLGCIVGFVALAFLLAFLKRRAVVYKRKPAAASKEASKMDPSKDPL